MYVQCLRTCMGLFEHVEGKPPNLMAKNLFPYYNGHNLVVYNIFKYTHMYKAMYTYLHVIG